MRDKKAAENLRQAKTEATRRYAEATKEARQWELIIEDLDAELVEIAQDGKKPMYGKARIGVMLAIALILAAVALTGCKATAGLGRDITWVGEAGEKMLQYESRNK